MHCIRFITSVKRHGKHGLTDVYHLISTIKLLLLVLSTKHGTPLLLFLWP